jgi:hypothetical protein
MNELHGYEHEFDAQQTLFGDEKPPSEAARKFLKFHDENPDVYWRLVRMLQDAKAAGRIRIGMGMLFEVLRWQTMLETSDQDFKLNNNYRAWYTRLISVRRPDLGEIITKRTSEAGDYLHHLEANGKGE